LEVEEISLKDAVKFVVDNRGKTCPVQDSGTPLISTACIDNERLYPDLKTERFVSDETFRSWFRSHPEPMDVILTNKGSKNGQVCLVPSQVNFCIAQDMVALRANEKEIKPSYLFAALRSPLIQSRIKALNVDAVIPHFKKTDFDKLFIPCPTLKIQEFVGEQYLSFCRKIELNHKMNQTLEDFAKAIFKSWFVDFDPVRAKVEGRPTGLPSEISDLFPDELVDSEIGGIPSGWSVCTLGDLVCPKKGKSITKKKVVEGSVPVVAGGLSPAYYHNTSNVNAPVVTISASGANAGFARLYNEDIWASDCSYISEEQTPFVFLWYIFLKIHQEKIYHMQQGAAQPHIYPSDLMRLQLAYPESDELWCRALDLITPMFQRMGNADNESVALSELRDTLLPKLISGELRIPDAEKFLDEAGI